MSTLHAFAQFNSQGLNLLRSHCDVHFNGTCREKFGKDKLREYAELECGVYVVATNTQTGDALYLVYNKEAFDNYYKKAERLTSALTAEAGYTRLTP